MSATELWISLVIFYLIYAVLGVANTWLMIRFSRRSIGDDPLAKITDGGEGGSGGTGTISTTDAEPDSSHEDDDDLALVY